MINKFITILFLSMLTNQAHATGIEIAVIAGIAVTVGDVILIASVALSTYMMVQAQNVGTGSQTQSDQKQTIKVTRPPKQIIYGKGLFAGSMIFAEESDKESYYIDGSGQKKFNTTKQEWLYTAHGLCDHEIEGIETIYFDERPISEFSGYSKVTVHNNDTVVDDDLLNLTASWESDMIGTGTTWLKVGMKYDTEFYAAGIPTVAAIVKGRKVYDPRTGITAYSNNAALVIFDYFTTQRGIDPSRMITSGFGSFIDAANLCDEIVNGEPRYTINGRFNLSEKPLDILGSLLASCGGKLVRIAGNIGLLPAAYYGGNAITITSSDIIGDITIQPELNYSDSINTMTGTFVDPEQNYSETEYTPIVDEAALARVGGEISNDMNFIFVTNSDQAQRLASIALNRALSGGGVELQVNLKGLYCRVGMVINLDIPELNLVGEFSVEKTSMHIKDGVTLSLANDGPSIYNDSIGTPFISPALTNLSTLGIKEPSSLNLIVEKVGDIIQGALTWEVNDYRSSRTDIRVKTVPDGDIILSDTSSGEIYPINGLIAGNYAFEVRTITSDGQASEWVSSSFLIDVPSAPDSVDVDKSNWNIRLTPNVSIGVPVGTLFEFKYLADSESYLTGNPTYTAANISTAETIFSGSSFNHGGLTPDRYHHYWIRAINSYGASAWVYIQTWTTRESDLVTTVIERLESIEIVSSNYLEGENGYKINVDGSAEFNDIKVRGEIEATKLTFVDGADASGLLGNIDLYESQTELQITGGGYEIDSTQGWGIKSNGYAEFLGGINVKNATIEGATIIGGEIYTGNIYFTIDYDTDGDDDVIKYDDYPDIPLAAASSYGSPDSKRISIVDGQVNTHSFGAFNVVTCTKKSGPHNPNRFRWGKIRERAFVLKGSYPRGDVEDGLVHNKKNRAVSYYVRIRFHHETGISSAGKDVVFESAGTPVGGYRENTHSVSLNGVTFIIKTVAQYTSGYYTQNTYWKIMEIEVYNQAATQYSTTDDTLNGAFEIQLVFDADVENGTRGEKMLLTSELTVDNLNYPG